MLRIPYLNNTFFHTYSPTAVDALRSTNPQLHQLDIRPGSIKTLASLYSQNFKNQQDSYRTNVTTFHDAVKGVNSSAKAITAKGFFDQKYVTSDSSAVSGQAKTGAKSAQYEVTVSQLATGQRNESAKVNGGGYGALASGSYTFGISAGTGVEKQVAVNVSATDTNKQVLSKFAAAINNGNTGVRAEVKTDGDKQYLSLQGKDTGAASTFSLRDISGNAVSSLNLSNTAQAAQDAKYTVNGTAYQSSSNKVSLDNGNVTLQLNKTSVDKVKVSVGEDPNKLAEAVGSLVNQYNKLNEVVSNSGFMTSRGEKLLSGVQSLVSRRSSELAQMGITMDSGTGQLAVDEKKLSSALASSPDKVKSALAGSGGLAKNLEGLSKAIMDMPMSSYVKAPDVSQALGYGNGFQGFSSLNKQNMAAQGLFFDMTV